MQVSVFACGKKRVSENRLSSADSALVRRFAFYHVLDLAVEDLAEIIYQLSSYTLVMS